jgi:MFS family permease
MISPTSNAGTPKPSPMLAAAVPDEPAENHSEEDQHWWSVLVPQPGTVSQLICLLKNPTFISATLIITMAGAIKGSVEEMLPFHADHQWGYEPLQIGQLFCTTAVAFFVAAAIVSQIWLGLGRFQNAFSSQCIFLLGVTACMSFHVAYYYKDERLLFGTFAGYGFCAGLAFTAASQLIAEVVDHAEGHAKDAANGIWNTMWEVGGSTGFFLGGYLAHHYKDQMTFSIQLMACALVTSICMLLAGGVRADKGVDKVEKILDYGSTA